MKKSLFFTMLCLFAMFNSLNAQETYEQLIGDPNSEYQSANLPNQTYYNYSISQQIYTAEELGNVSSAKITSISFKTKNGRGVTRRFDVYMVNTEDTDFSYFKNVGADKLVYSDYVTFPNGTGWVKIEFTTPFEYTGGNVLVCVNDISGTYVNDTPFYVYTTGFTSRSVSAFNDYNPHDPQTIAGENNIQGMNYPNVTIDYSYYQVNNVVKFTMTGSGGGESVVEGDNIQNPIVVESLPFEHTPVYADLNDDYALPGDTPDGKDVVYKLVLEEETTISASVEGTNGKIAVYDANSAPAGNFYYDFESADQFDEFSLKDLDGDGYNFEMTSYGNGNDFIQSFSYYSGCRNPNNVIYTKKKHHITDNSQLSYQVALATTSFCDTYSVVISEDGNSFTDIITETPGSSNFTLKTINMSGYSGKDLYIGFRHHDSYCKESIYFDNFGLTLSNSKSSRGDNSIEGIVLQAGTYHIVASATEAFTVNIVKNNFIAEVNGIKYESMEEAVEAATAGQTVTLLKDAEGPAFNVNKSITIDFNNKTYTINDSNPVDISAGTLTLINGTFAGQDGFKNLVNITGGAQLVHNTAITGTITKSVEGTNQGWGTISTPVGNVSHANVTGLLSGKPELYLYDEANEYWRYYSDTENSEYVAQPFTSLEAGRGYLYANENNTDVVFEGTFGVSSVNFDLSCASEGQLRGFNMIGNPFTHDVNEVNFSTSGGASLSDGFYVISGGGAWTAKTNDTYIAPMESALVKTNMATTLTISNAPTSKSRGESKGYLKIDVSNSNYSDVAYVSFDSGLGLDKIAHRNAEIPMVYVPVDGVNYAIAKMDESVTEVPVSFKAMTMGEYTISAKALGCEYEQITLVDKMTGVMTNMLLEDYTFIARTTDKSERFLIKLVAKEDAEDTEHFAYINNGALVINSIKGEGRVRIFDVMGRSVAEYEVSGSANIPVVSLRSGVYLVHKSDENGVKVQKVVID